jgi:hypothetical protein
MHFTRTDTIPEGRRGCGISSVVIMVDVMMMMMMMIMIVCWGDNNL